MFHLVSSTSGSVSSCFSAFAANSLATSSSPDRAHHYSYLHTPRDAWNVLTLLPALLSAFGFNFICILGQKQFIVIYTLMAVAAVQVADQQIRSSFSLVSCPRTLQHADCQGNQTSNLLITRCCLYPWATAALHQIDSCLLKYQSQVAGISLRRVIWWARLTPKIAIVNSCD